MEDYKIRFIKEYQELKYRYDKLCNIIDKYISGCLEFNLSCPIELLQQQQIAMEKYLEILEERAKIEKVNLEV